MHFQVWYKPYHWWPLNTTAVGSQVLELGNRCGCRSLEPKENRCSNHLNVVVDSFECRLLICLLFEAWRLCEEAKCSKPEQAQLYLMYQVGWRDSGKRFTIGLPRIRKTRLDSSHAISSEISLDKTETDGQWHSCYMLLYCCGAPSVAWLGLDLFIPFSCLLVTLCASRLDLQGAEEMEAEEVMLRSHQESLQLKRIRDLWCPFPIGPLAHWPIGPFRIHLVDEWRG